MLSLHAAALSYAPTTIPAAAAHGRVSASPVMDMMTFIDDFSPDATPQKPWTSNEISDKAGLEELANKLNPIFGYFDPLNIGETRKENIAWFRQAEIKHGRVAMAAFVGYCVQAAGIHWPWNLQGFPGTGSPVISYADISAAGGPADQWDALPSPAKIQILLAIGFLEVVGEASILMEAEGQQHYVRGGKPGFYPSLSKNMPHFCLDLYDPFGLAKKMTQEQKDKRLLMEINNGRWAMIGILGLISDAKGLIVPGINSLNLPKYAGEFMAPFSSTNADLPFVTEMLTLRSEQMARELFWLGVPYPGA